VVPIELPPLRKRREDIRDLAQHFLARTAAEHGRAAQTLSEGALQLLDRYRWPGNIRELENIMARMTVVCDSEIIEESDLPYDFALTASATAGGRERGPEPRCRHPRLREELSCARRSSGTSGTARRRPSSSTSATRR